MIRDYFRDNGLEQYDLYPPIHGNGLAEAESPYPDENTKTPFAPGIGFNFDVSLFGHPVAGSNRIEEGFIVTDTGLLTLSPLISSLRKQYLGGSVIVIERRWSVRMRPESHGGKEVIRRSGCDLRGTSRRDVPVEEDRVSNTREGDIAMKREKLFRRPGRAHRADDAPGPRRPRDRARTEKITLTVMNYAQVEKAFVVINQEFTKAHPNVSIEYQPTPYDSYQQKYGAVIATKSGPDVMMNELFYVYATADAFVPLNDKVKSEPKVFEDLLAYNMMYRYMDPTGPLLSLPMSYNGCALYYNKDIFKQAGLDPNNPPKSWDEFSKACEAVKKIGKAPIAQAGGGGSPLLELARNAEELLERQGNAGVRPRQDRLDGSQDDERPEAPRLDG